MMIIIESIDHVELQVSDIAASIEFYRENFGFDILDYAEGSSEAYLQVGDIRVRLEKVKSGTISGGYVAFHVDEDDYEDALEEIEESGIAVEAASENFRYWRRVVIKDPDDNRIALCTSK